MASVHDRRLLVQFAPEPFYDQPAFYTNRTAVPGGIQGAGSSPDTFQLEEHSPVYALSNGELVAARYPLAGDVSMAFVLLRHEVYHRTDLTAAARLAGGAILADASQGGPADIGRIDYIMEPTTVYSLYMHLGRHNNMNFGQVDDHNPDWLNRVLIRMTECDLAMPPTSPAGTLHATLNPWAADLTAPPSMAGPRPTPRESWQMDQERYRNFLTVLASGQVAVAPYRNRSDTMGPTPVRVILGDYLGVAGVIRKQAGVSTFGVRIEVFSPQLVNIAFTPVAGQSNWQPPAGVMRPAVFYPSEWAHVLDDTESAAMRNIGVDPLNVFWWEDVALTQHLWDVRAPDDAKLPIDGGVFHYQPITFMQWINDVTWSSEWPKYRVVNGAPPVVAPRPAQPRDRRF